MSRSGLARRGGAVAVVGDEGGGSHEVTHCSCEDKHFKEEVLDTTFATTPEKMHKLMFDSAFLTKVR